MLRSLQATRLPVARFQRFFLARSGTFLYIKRKKMAIATSKRRRSHFDYMKTDFLFELDDDDQV